MTVSSSDVMLVF